MHISLGSKYVSKNTGFQGTATAVAHYLNANERVELSGADTTGRPIEWWFDVKDVVESNETVPGSEAEAPAEAPATTDPEGS